MVQINPANGHDPVNRWLTRLILIGWFVLELAVIAFVISEIIRLSLGV
jgi:hypothetical protein